ncbi:thioredoxin family protein [Phenylobacterium sp.]|uniref:DUF899 domain-containing protein n=1 Tax=Phenylobacterium sp. TaxID=1871053 RepID=UPI0030F3F1A0
MRAESVTPAIVSRDAWLTQRLDLLARERELTRHRDAVAAQRRALPWVAVETDYVFDTPAGPRRLAELFDGRSQLAVYHFMLAPGSDHLCPGCSFLCDHVDAARRHFEHGDLTFTAISRAPLDEIAAVKRRMGWTFDWASSGATSFNADYGVFYTPEQVAAGRADYNYGTTPGWAGDLHGLSVFARDEAGAVFHTYSQYARASETLLGAFNWLDLTPKGRNEGEGPMNWVRLHDEYDDAPAHTCCSS